MVKLMLDGLGGDRRESRTGKRQGDVQSGGLATENAVSTEASAAPVIECYHVNCRVSEDMEDIGAFRMGKVFQLIKYCAEAIWCRFRYGVTNFYYVPAPAKRAALYRDWIVMALCRPFFKRIIFHWHAAGVGDWLYGEGDGSGSPSQARRVERWISKLLIGRPDLSLALSVPSMRSALWMRSRRVEIVPNGIPDPCPDFEETLLPLRQARLARRKGAPAEAPGRGEGLKQSQVLSPSRKDAPSPDPSHEDPLRGSAAPREIIRFKVLFLAHCTREKGLFDTLEGVALANARLAESAPLRLELTVAGLFMDPKDRAEFDERIARPDLAGAVQYAGFISGEDKDRLLRESDCLAFPTYYPAEGQPVNLIEAMAYGLPAVTSRWRAIPEILVSEYPAFVPPQAPERIAAAFERLLFHDDFVGLRRHFLANFTEHRHLERLKAVVAASVSEVLL